MVTDEDFEGELRIFQEETDLAIQSFHAYMSIHDQAARNPDFFHFLNRTPTFWVTCVNALQTTTIMSLGRIFDQSSAHNLDVLISMAQRGAAIFAKSSLESRILKRAVSVQDRPKWIDDLLQDAYQPTPTDFRLVRKLVWNHRRIYCERYQDLRHLWFAHRVVTQDQILQVFAKTNVDELKELLNFLYFIYGELWRLFFNGRKLNLDDRRPSSDMPNSQRVAQEIVDMVEYIFSDKIRKSTISD